MKSPSPQDPARLKKLFEHLAAALDESPAPAYEWPRLAEILGIDQLARLLQVSPSSVRRYKESARTTPDDVAAPRSVTAFRHGDPRFPSLWEDPRQPPASGLVATIAILDHVPVK